MMVTLLNLIDDLCTRHLHNEKSHRWNEHWRNDSKRMTSVSFIPKTYITQKPNNQSQKVQRILYPPAEEWRVRVFATDA